MAQNQIPRQSRTPRAETAGIYAVPEGRADEDDL
ncbi:hypothetical protein STFR1_40167 [Bacillus vallismortis]